MKAENVSQGIASVVGAIENEEVTRQAARSTGVTASEEELHERLRTRLSVSPEASRETLASSLRSELLRLGLPLGEYQDIVKYEVLNRKLRSGFEAQVPAETEHVDIRLIQTETREKAQEAKAQIDGGRSIALVTVDFSTHSSAKASAGELGWIPLGALPAPIEQFAFNSTGVSNIIETDRGFFIIESRAKEVRTVSSEGKGQIVDHQVGLLKGKTREDLGVETGLTVQQAQRLALSIARAPLG